MLRYILKRLVSMIPSLFIVSIVVFLFIHFIPGDPAAILLGDMATPEQVQQLRQEMGLDRPLYVQYLFWIRNAVKGNLGNSIFFHQPVLGVISSRAETSILLATMTFILILCIGIPVGYISATRYGSKLDQFISSASMGFASIPTFWLGLNLMIFFAVYLKLFPSSGFPSILKDGKLSNLIYLAGC